MKSEIVTPPGITPQRRCADAQPGRDELERLILAALDDQPEQRWTTLRRGLPGTRGAQTRALVALHDTGTVHALKIAGQTWVAAA